LIRRQIKLEPRSRGFHLVTDEVTRALPELESVEVGLLHLLIRHTSASLTINENASPDVRRDLRAWADLAVPEDFDWAHTLEGADDMPAHVKGTITGFEMTLPVTDGRLDLGTWQGIYLCEHRDHGGPRTVTATIHT
jgi:secondary thiamine-phosphate synthase enzyme